MILAKMNVPLFAGLCGCLLITGCADTQVVVDEDLTGLNVLVYFEQALQLEQLKIVGWQSNQEEAFEPAHIPEEPRPIDGTEQSFVLLLPDALAEQTIRLDVKGYAQGAAVAAGSISVVIQLNRLVEVNVVIESEQLCEVDIDNFSSKLQNYNQKFKSTNNFVQYSPISDLPYSIRDLSFSIKDFSKRKLLEDYILQFQDELLKDVYIFDYFHNEKNEEIKIGFRFVFQSPDSTITEFQVNDIISDIISYTQKIKGITLPGLK